MARSTPARLRLLSLAVIVGVALSGLTAFVAARSLSSSTDVVRENTGPVLIAVQDVSASLAEADASATALYLSGLDEDPAQQRLYDQALTRTSTQLQSVARLIGDDETAHRQLQDIAGRVVRYAEDVQGARTANQASLPDAVRDLEAAQTLLRDDLSPAVAELTERTQQRLDEDIASGRVAFWVAVAAAVIALAVLAWAQWTVFGLSHRVLNPPLAVATVLVLAALVWLGRAYTDQQDALDQARAGGYDSIALTAQIQQTSFRYKGDESLALITGTEAISRDTQLERAAALVPIVVDDDIYRAARRGDAPGSGLLVEANRTADSTREQAATAELLVRWQRYLDVSEAIAEAQSGGDAATAVALTIGPGAQSFNGFNTAVESVLSDNRDQFLDELGEATQALRGLELITVLLAILAAAAALWGFQLRIDEYR